LLCLAPSLYDVVICALLPCFTMVYVHALVLFRSYPLATAEPGERRTRRALLQQTAMTRSRLCRVCYVGWCIPPDARPLRCREAPAGRPGHGRIPSDACQASSRGPVAGRPGLGRARPMFPVNDILDDCFSARPPATTLLTYVLVTVAHELKRWLPPRSYLAPQSVSTGCWSTNAVNQHPRKIILEQPSGASLTRLFHLLPDAGNARTTSRTK